MKIKTTVNTKAPFQTRQFSIVVWLLTIALSLMLINVIWICFAPGFMSYDSLVQYGSADINKYTDSHPAIMAYLWHLVLIPYSGPKWMLVIHLSLLFVGIILWCYNCSGSSLKILIPCLFFLPWILNFSGVIWKDVGMAFSLLLATGLIFNKDKKKLLFFAAIPFLFYAQSVRHNGILATAPVIFLGIKFIFDNNDHIGRFVKPFILTILTLFVFSIINSQLTYKILDAEKKHFEAVVMGDEIASISAVTGENLLPWIKYQDIVECSKYKIFDDRSHCYSSKGYEPNGLYGSLVVNNPVESTHSIWINAVISNPIKYLRIKLDAFLFFIKSPSLTPYYIFQAGIQDNPWGYKVFHTDASELVNQYVKVSAAYFPEIFKPYFWALASILMLLLSYFDRNSVSKVQILALNISSLAYFLSYFFVGLAADFRYIYWCIIATSISAIILLTSIESGNTKNFETS